MPDKRILAISLILTVSCLFMWPAGAVAKSGQTRGFKVPPGWCSHKGKGGLLAFYPCRWKLTRGESGSFWATLPSPGGGYHALALAKPIQGGKDAKAVLRGIRTMFPRAFGQIRITRLRKMSQRPDVAEALFQYRPGGIGYQGIAMCLKRNDRGMLYIIAARKDRWQKLSRTGQRILQSFWYSAKTRGASAGPALKMPAMVPWTDPIEAAFSARVPRGWQVSGGMKRYHAVDVRPELLIESPDKNILVRLGDWDIPPMAQSNQYLTRMNKPPGSTYSPGYGLQLVVMPYLPGYRYATQLYLPQKVGRISNVKVQDLPRAASRAQAAHRLSGLDVEVSTGQVQFSATGQGGPRKGYAFMQTTRIPLPANPAMGLWHVEIIYGYLARPDREALAQRVLNAVVQSFQFNQGWLERQAQTAGQVSNIVVKTNQEITRIIRDSFNKRQQVMDRAMDRYVRGAVRETVLVEDPNTNERFEVPGGSNYYWRQQAGGAIAGTQTDTRPYSPNYWLERMRILD